MVTVEWHGRKGNNLFQYVFGRLLAVKNNLKMGTNWPHQSFIRTSHHEQGETHHEPIVKINDLYYAQHDQNWFSSSYRGKRVYCSGFFQHHKYYDADEALIRSFFILDQYQKRPSSDIVMHIRLGDYAEPGLRSVIQPGWYGKILQRLKYNPKTHRLFIVCENPNDPYLKKFLHYKPEIISQSAAEDFHFIRSFDTILCSNSSFCWWAAFLSNASRIFTFSHWIREPHRYKLRLAFMRRATPVIGTWLP